MNACTAAAASRIGLWLNNQAQRPGEWHAAQGGEVRGLTAEDIKVSIAKAQRIRRAQCEVGNIHKAGTLAEMNPTRRQPEEVGR